ncbi:hypothetical protein GCM10025873_01710 [Demequina sediminis]|uniref:hypothetical protein n=1 Tax=Demequina sediminis TaxID=1930058 RepID=UPI0025736F4F|nr:hypothetical protein [Demequina sediminis]BDZ60380.1 hypothetical protein GCM10025873_01710 [Demequina sediminis]
MERRLPPWASGALGAVGIVAAWWILSVTVFANVGSGNTKAVPTPWQVAQGYADSGWEFYVRNFTVTLNEAAQGYLWGNGIALLLAGIVLVAPVSTAWSTRSRSSPTASRSSRSAPSSC